MIIQANWCELLEEIIMSQFRWSVTLSRWPCLLHPSFIIELEGDVKQPTLLFEKSRGSFPGGVVYLYVCYHLIYHTYSKLTNGPIAAASGALYADVRAYCSHIKMWRGHVVVVLSSSFFFYYTLSNTTRHASRIHIRWFLSDTEFS